ncbi:MAG TPA: tRNA (N6-isopentenyl adenosine(37)-C2)-methylthiotransferase MiaB [Pyrinomonadaceae bacterium]|nr:tRNA (N6-isopentenyl adenosine(37)-C2)-methylthiotransferase MiaB [Pyrinomonadaceae bacterium]
MSTRVYIETLGCQMNVSDSERAATGLRKAGYDLIDSAEDAEVVLFNTCSVRERAEQKVFNRIGEVRKQRGNNQPLVGVMGCVAQLEGEKIFDNAGAVDFVAGTQATDRLPSLIDRVRGGEAQVLDLAERAEGETWDISPVERHSPYVAFVPIIEGCNKFCSFCIVPYSRGREKSRIAKDIIGEVQRLKSLGYQEVHLIGQNVNSYRPKSQDGLDGFPGATPFARLLRAVAATGIERIKFTTSFPRDFHPDIVSAIEEHPNLCDWIHLPVQSGSDRILQAMRRGHDARNYLQRVERIRNSRRRLSLTSDVIVGFPGETKEDFEATLKLIEQCRYDSLYIFKYSKRSGTPAAKLSDDLTVAEMSERFLEIERVQRDIQREIYADYVGRTVSVLAEKQSARSVEDMTGHTTCNKVVNFSGGLEMQGKIINVLITEAKNYSLYGRAC